jgi:hypothetical protein
MHEKTKQLQKELAVRKEEETRKQAVRDQHKDQTKEVKEVKDKKTEETPKATEEKAKVEIAA